MDRQRINEISDFFYKQLTEETLPFWVPRCVDKEYGGFITYFDRKGNIRDTDKNGWVQGRMTWMFARMYNELEQRKEWLDLARHGYEFLKSKIIDAEGRGWFTVTRDGKPVRRRRYLFVECFAVIGFAEYYRATKEREALDLARRSLDLIERYIKDPSLNQQKFESTAEKTRGHSLTMILISVYQVMRAADPERDYNALIDRQIKEIFDYFVHPELNALLETVGPNGEFIDSPAGRCLNPGHAIETAWFILEEARYRNDKKLQEKALPILDWSFERGWDQQHGGLLSFLDVKGYQPEQLEWDMKFWWPHNETIYATLLAHHLTGNEKYEKWFDQTLEYAYRNFPDSEYGEWFGYLHRDGSVALDLKANNWKSFFHHPRHQLYCYKLLGEMA